MRSGREICIVDADLFDKMIGVLEKHRGFSHARFKSVGNHGWLGHYGATRITLVSSSVILVRQSFIRQKGGNAYL